jgi:hypothetical protein
MCWLSQSHRLLITKQKREEGGEEQLEFNVCLKEIDIHNMYMYICMQQTLSRPCILSSVKSDGNSRGYSSRVFMYEATTIQN